MVCYIVNITYFWFVIVLTHYYQMFKLRMIIVHDPLLHDLGLQTKRKFACPACGPKMKSRHSRTLRKQVFHEFRHFLHNNHRYRIAEKHLFNGKEETSSRPRRMTPHLWKLEYDRLNCRGNIQFVVRSLKFVF